MDMTQEHLSNPAGDEPEGNEGEQPLSLEELVDILQAIEDQPHWRAKADREMDFLDGNQLDSELLRKQRDLGIPPAVENIMAPTIEGIVGMEAKTRTDWRLTPEGGPDGQDVADALNFKLNQAERQSHADKACTDAFRQQACVGVGWVEVARESDPTKFKYRCSAVHRNEMFWDMTERNDPRLERCAWVMRRQWILAKRLKLAFPQHRALIEACGRGDLGEFGMVNGIEGGTSTGLSDGTGSARGWTVEEMNWYQRDSKKVLITEIWYRRWVQLAMFTTPDGRVVEFDEDNPVHLQAFTRGLVRPTLSVVSRIRRAYWLGPHQLADDPTPYAHRSFPYVLFRGGVEDSTGAPYGVLRSMMFPQETLNSGISKLRWGMSAVRTERTKGAVAMSDADFRRMVARVDADIVLDEAHMSKQGARFEVKRDYTLSEQHYKMVEDARVSIERVGPGSAGFLGKQGNATSGLQEQTQVEQATQRLAGLMDNFKEGRTQVGELLLSMIIQDLGDQRDVVVIDGDALKEPRTVVLNGPEVDPQTRMPYLSNDVQRTRLKVALEDVPTSSSFRAQQLSALSEAVKAMPPRLQQAVFPFMAALMDLPNKRDVIQAIREASAMESPEAVEKRIREELASQNKARELDIKEKVSNAEAVQIGVQAAFSAMQAGAQIAQMPQIAPIADEVMKGAGYTRPAAGDDPNFPVPAQPAVQPGAAAAAPAGEGVSGVRENTSPAFPPVPQEPAQGMRGIETPRVEDNMPA